MPFYAVVKSDYFGPWSRSYHVLRTQYYLTMLIISGLRFAIDFASK